jgi:O-antigen ligase
MLTAFAFMMFNCASYFLALFRSPFWGLFAYLNIYFNVPNARLNWWADYLPFDRWSLLTSAVLVISVAIHWKKRSTHGFSAALWIPLFLLVSLFVSLHDPVSEKAAFEHLYLLFTYALIVFIIIKSIADWDELRLFILSLVGFAGYLSVGAYLYGDRVNMRLEQFGSADSNGSNEFALLLAGILPFVFSFLRGGKLYEKIVCIVSLPFIVNAFILCNSRGATAAIAGAVIISATFVADKDLRKKLFIAMLAALPLFIYLADDEYKERFATFIGVREAIEDERSARDLTSGRTEIWMYGIEMAKDHPLGAGPDGFAQMARFYMPTEVLTFKPGAEHGTRSAHNTYLQVAVEQGIIGLLIWAALCLHVCILLYKGIRRIKQQPDKNPLWKDHILAMNVAFYSILIGGMINSRIYYEYFWWQIAMAVVVFALVIRAEQESKTEVG